MHSRIFQISATPIDEGDYINENYVSESDYGYYGIDYCSVSYDREDDIDWLKSGMPDGLMEFEGDKITVIPGGVDKYLCSLYDTMKSEFDKITPENILSYGSCKLRHLLNTCYSGDFLFYITGYNDSVCSMRSLLDFLKEHEGETLYVGNILDYHFLLQK